MSTFRLAADETLDLRPGWLVPGQADQLFNSLSANVAWLQQTIRMFGRDVFEPRLTAWYGDPDAIYTYSGRRNTPLPWLPELTAIRTRLETELGHPFNSVLLNLYRDGRDSMGLHTDDEPVLGPSPTIASVSLGATRRFRLLHRQRKNERIVLSLAHGSLLVMGGALQHRWRHGVPKELAVEQSRINLTFRRIRGVYEAAVEPAVQSRRRRG